MNDKDEAKSFYPKGAIAFFAVMTVFYLGLWLVFYMILVGRH